MLKRSVSFPQAFKIDNRLDRPGLVREIVTHLERTWPSGSAIACNNLLSGCKLFVTLSTLLATQCFLYGMERICDIFSDKRQIVENKAVNEEGGRERERQKERIVSGYHAFNIPNYRVIRLARMPGDEDSRTGTTLTTSAFAPGCKCCILATMALTIILVLSWSGHYQEHYKK